MNAGHNAEKGLTESVPLGLVFTAKGRNQTPQGDEGHAYILVAPPPSHNADPARKIPQ